MSPDHPLKLSDQSLKHLTYQESQLTRVKSVQLTKTKFSMNVYRNTVVRLNLGVQSGFWRTLTKACLLVQPDDCVEVQMVGGFVQHQQGWLHEQRSVNGPGQTPRLKRHSLHTKTLFCSSVSQAFHYTSFTQPNKDWNAFCAGLSVTHFTTPTQPSKDWEAFSAGLWVKHFTTQTLHNPARTEKLSAFKQLDLIIK